MQITVPFANLTISNASVTMLNCDTMIVIGGEPNDRLATSAHIWTGVMAETTMTEGRTWTAGL